MYQVVGIDLSESVWYKIKVIYPRPVTVGVHKCRSPPSHYHLGQSLG